MFFHIGRFYLLLKRVVGRPEKLSIYWQQYMIECGKVGIGSLLIVLIISMFMGAVITMQTGAMIAESAWIPSYTLGYTTRQSTILEFSPTIICLILAGKVGSNIAGEIGTMRVTEQIDALDIMGVNSASYLIGPKMLATMTMFPFLVIYSMLLSMYGGYLACELIDKLPSPEVYVEGIRYYFEGYTIKYALVKPVVFGFIISMVSSYYGYFTKGGALDVGKASTNAVVTSSILILVFNLIITQLMLI